MKIEHRLEHSEFEKEYRMKSNVQRSIVYKKSVDEALRLTNGRDKWKKKLHGCERKIVWLRILYLPEDKKRWENLTDKTRLCWSDNPPSLVSNHSRRMRTWKTNKSEHRPQKQEHILMQLHTIIVWRKKILMWPREALKFGDQSSHQNDFFCLGLNNYVRLHWHENYWRCYRWGYQLSRNLCMQR